MPDWSGQHRRAYHFRDYQIRDSLPWTDHVLVELLDKPRQLVRVAQVPDHGANVIELQHNSLKPLIAIQQGFSR